LAPVVLLEKLQSFRNRHLTFPFDLSENAPGSLLPPTRVKQRLCQLSKCRSRRVAISGGPSKEAGYAE
jgi:hypothetical protein